MASLQIARVYGDKALEAFHADRPFDAARHALTALREAKGSKAHDAPRHAARYAVSMWRYLFQAFPGEHDPQRLAELSRMRAELRALTGV